MTLRGTLNPNGVIVLDEPAPLPDGTRVEVQLTVVPPSSAQDNERAPTLAQRLLKHAGTVPDLPADVAAQHDHYIHGTRPDDGY